MKLKHDKDPLAENERFLANVEAVLDKVPDRFFALRLLLQWISENKSRCKCGFPIRRQDMRYYRDNDSGLVIPGESTKCWIYSHCPNCGYDYNFEKIMNQKDRYEVMH